MINEQHQSFEGLKQYSEDNVEYWSARDLAPLLEYRDWRNFENVIKKAMHACKASQRHVEDHFVEATKMVTLGSDSKRKLDDVHLSRYACYLVVQNGDPTKTVIAAGQTYFAIQTRRQELADDATFQKLKDDQKRLLLRNDTGAQQTASRNSPTGWSRNWTRFCHLPQSWIPRSLWRARPV